MAAAIGATALVAVQQPSANAATDFFTDDSGSVHEANINAIAELGITKGCNPPANTNYCPSGGVTRGQMAAFLGRALGLTAGTGSNLFADDDGSVFEADIDRLGTAAITKGCNPPANTNYCPNNTVTRAQMAAFIVRALGLTDRGTKDFADDNGSIFEPDIERLATAGITVGCNPPANTNYCPNATVTRAQMATFLIRMVGLLTPTVLPISNKTVPEGGVLTVPISVERPQEFDDPDSAFVLTVTGLPMFGALTDQGDGTGELGFTPGFADTGSYPMTVTATRKGHTDTESFTLTVTNVNRAPTLTDPGNQTSGEGSAIALEMPSADPDAGDVLTYGATGLPPNLDINAATGLISGSISGTAAGVYSVTVTVTDNGGLFAAAAFTWTVVDTNQNPTLDAVADQTNFEGDTGISLALVGADPDPGDLVTFSQTGLPPGLGIDAGTGLITGTIDADGGGIYTVVVTVTDDGTPILSAQRTFTWSVFGPQAELTVTEVGGRSASTREPESMVLRNTSKGGVTIDSISIDVSTALFPDLVWDPEGTGGDPGFQCLTATAVDAATVGFTPGPSVRPCAAPFFTAPHDGGWDVLTIPFDDFDEGEEFHFWVETDPTSIKEGGGAGLVSGMELTGATVTVTFSTGAITTELFRIKDNDGGGHAIARLGTPTAPPDISIDATIAGPAVWDASHAPGGTVTVGTTATIDHTVTVTGAEGAMVRVLVVRSEMDLLAGPGFDIDPFEANEALQIKEFAGTIAGGSVAIAVPLVGKGDFFYLVAAIVDDDGDPGTMDPTSLTSNIIVVRQDGGNTVPELEAIATQTNAEGDPVALQLVGSDPDPGQTLTWAVDTGLGNDPLPAGLVLSPTTGLISGTIAGGAAGSYLVRVRIDDDHPTNPATAFRVFAWTVSGP